MKENYYQLFQRNINFIKQNLGRCPYDAKNNILKSLNTISDIVKNMKEEKTMTKMEFPQDNNINGNLTKSNIYTLKQLKSYYDGRGGRPGYIAVNGVVYNITLAENWGGGTFMGMTQGEDLSKFFNTHPKEYTKLKNNAIKVGVLEGAVNGKVI